MKGAETPVAKEQNEIVRWSITILSGGQTGAERAALDFALAHDLPHGGWSAEGRLALDGPLGSQYALRETPSEHSTESTEWNVRDADATVVFTLEPKATGGAKRTLACARRTKKPCLHLHRGLLAVSEKLAMFVERHHVRRLNVAGSEEEREPGLYAWVFSELENTEGIILHGKDTYCHVRHGA